MADLTSAEYTTAPSDAHCSAFSVDLVQPRTKKLNNILIAVWQ